MTVDVEGRVGPFRFAGGEPDVRTAVAGANRVEDWRGLLREHFVALDVTDVDRRNQERFSSAVRSTLIGHLSVAEVSSAPQSCVRTVRLAADDSRQYLQVGVVASGSAVVEQDGREAVVERGHFAVYETDRPFAWHFAEPWRLLVLTWPRALVDLDHHVSHSATARPLGDGRLGTIVTRMLAETVLTPPSEEDGVRLAGELSALVATTIDSPARTEETLSASSARDLRRRVATYVADRVEGPAPTAEELALAHHVSVRTLHRAFADAGITVGWLVRRLRLAHARHRLVAPRDADLSLTDLAHDCGFADLPAFSRAFKPEYRENPSTYRRHGSLPGLRR